jgi:hypothetical protein
MANSLNMPLMDKVVVIDKEYMDEKYADIKQRIFKVTGGFGAQSFTSGSALIGVFLCDGSTGRVNSAFVERLATEEEIKSVATC